MVILTEHLRGTSPLFYFAFVCFGLSVLAFIICVILTFYYKEEGGLACTVLLVTTVLIGIVVADNKDTVYSIYLTDMSYEEFVKDYKVIDTDGLIFEAVKREKNDDKD